MPLEYQLPKECWIGRKVDLSYLRTFGCLFYVLVDSDSKDKLDANSKKCYFIGYGGKEFGYLLWNDVDEKVIVRMLCSMKPLSTKTRVLLSQCKRLV